MPKPSRIAFTLALLTIALLGVATAQPPVVMGLTASPTLDHLTRCAGYIFSGTVTSVVKETASAGGDVATMRITFRVEQAIRGVQAGQLLTIREWAGLWDAGDRYQTGERLMLFLYPPSHLGLTSPVAGSQGRFSIDGNGRIMLPPARMTTLWPAASSRPATGTAMRSTIFAREIRQAVRK